MSDEEIDHRSWNAAIDAAVKSIEKEKVVEGTVFLHDPVHDAVMSALEHAACRIDNLRKEEA